MLNLQSYSAKLFNISVINPSSQLIDH